VPAPAQVVDADRVEHPGAELVDEAAAGEAVQDRPTGSIPSAEGVRLSGASGRDGRARRYAARRRWSGDGPRRARTSDKEFKVGGGSAEVLPEGAAGIRRAVPRGHAGSAGSA